MYFITRNEYIRNEWKKQGTENGKGYVSVSESPFDLHKIIEV